MRISTVGNVILGAGAIVGVVAIAAVAANYAPTLTPEMIKLLFFKGLGAAAVGLMIVGTLVARAGRIHERKIQEDFDGHRNISGTRNEKQLDSGAADRFGAPTSTGNASRATPQPHNVTRRTNDNS